MNHLFEKSAIALFVAGCLSSPVLAQDAPTEKESGVEVITVTGQKITSTLQDTKESVAVYTNKMLEERNLTNLADVFLQTPGVSGEQFGFRIRGVRNSDGSSLPNRGDLASVVIDGVTLSGWVKTEGAGQLWDVSQVEVLRGPQSTNLGRNALAGAIVVNTTDPEYANEGKVQVGLGNYGKKELKGVANINISDGVSAIRLAAERTDSDGFVENVTRNEDDYGRSEQSVYRLKWLYQPSDMLTSVFSYQRIDSEFGSASSYLGGYSKEDRVTQAGDPAIFQTKANLFSLNLEYEINNQWLLTSITAYQDGERTRFNDSDQTAVSVGNGGGIIRRFSEDNNWSQELRFNYDGDDVRGSSGVYFSGIEARRSQNNTIDLNLVALFDDFSPGLGTVMTTTAVLPVVLYQPIYDTAQAGKTDVDTSTWAVFSEWEVDLSEQWMLSFGLRYDSEEQDYTTASNTTSNYVLPATGSPLGAIPLGPLTVDQIITIANTQLAGLTKSVPENQKSENFSNLLPHAGITYEWNEDVSTSFFVKKSYRSGGSELTLLNGVNNFDAEELWNYEGALRAVVLDGKGVLNANVYYSDWTDQQVAIQEPGTTNSAFTMTVNAGESSLTGVEVSFTYQLSENVGIYTGLAVSKTEYEQFQSPDGSENYNGNTFSFAPERTGTLGLNYNAEGFFFNASVSYTGSSYSNVANTREMGGYTLANLNGGYEFDNIRLEAYVQNATDKLYDVNNNLRAGDRDRTRGFRLGAPREFGARMTYSF